MVEKELNVASDAEKLGQEIDSMIVLIKLNNYIVSGKFRIGKESAIEYTIRNEVTWFLSFRFHFDAELNLTQVKIMPYGASHNIMRRIRENLKEEQDIEMQFVDGTFVASETMSGMLSIIKATTFSF